jgi:membrane protease YdiL (CAAX protease family)
VELSPRPYNPVISIFITLVVVLVGFQLIGPFIGFFVAIPFYPGPVLQMVEDLKQPMAHPEMRLTLMIMQGFGTLIGLIIIPAMLLRRQGIAAVDFFKRPVYLQGLVLVIFIVMSFIVVDSVIAEWNQTIDFPEWLSSFEKWARATEDQLGKFSEFVTRFDSFGSVVLGLVVIALLPAVGEEIVFRGMIQRDLFRATHNIHVAIWTSAIIFSAFHLQFYGFVPRLLLGALFGYFYYWSDSLLLPILAHFVNNGLIVVSLYLYQSGVIDIDMESTVAAPWNAVIGSAIVMIILLFLLKQFYKQHPPLQQLPEN